MKNRRFGVYVGHHHAWDLVVHCFFSSELLHSFGWADLWWFHAISQQWYCAFLPGFLTHNRNMIYRKYVRIIYRYMKVMNVPWKSSHWILQWKYPKCGDLSSHAIAEGSYQHRGHEVSKQREGAGRVETRNRNPRKEKGYLTGGFTDFFFDGLKPPTSYRML